MYGACAVGEGGLYAGAAPFLSRCCARRKRSCGEGLDGVVCEWFTDAGWYGESSVLVNSRIDAPFWCVVGVVSS